MNTSLPSNRFYTVDTLLSHSHFFFRWIIHETISRHPYPPDCHYLRDDLGPRSNLAAYSTFPHRGRSFRPTPRESPVRQLPPPSIPRCCLRCEWYPSDGQLLGRFAHFPNDPMPLVPNSPSMCRVHSSLRPILCVRGTNNASEEKPVGQGEIPSRKR
jgi:hypothetical protein